MVLGPFRYAGPFLFVLSIPLFYYGIGPVAPLLTIALLLLLLIGAERLAPGARVENSRGAELAFRLVPFVYVPVQLGVIVWSVTQAGEGLSFAALALAAGITTGVFGVLAAHELVHNPKPMSQLFGVAMLSGMSYRHFRIAHVFGHHRMAATDQDPASARLGENVYRFLVRSIAGQYRDAWRIECARLRATEESLIRHRLLSDALVMVSLYIAILVLVGANGVILFAAQSAIGIIVLETFNYVAHYGLKRERGAFGHEPFGAAHSWNSSNRFANAFIFNMGHHSRHHARPTAQYQTLEHDDQASELPLGYTASMLLALIPPLWHQIMDPEVERLHTRSSNVSV
ncbi:MAG TPA: alkane 1-monooxygenase [Rhizomicrobium sp.]|jgi:alkane 1-monooxygenase|nr:alkane 1-monooxygenase [Rhizomicrobium sp.]